MSRRFEKRIEVETRRFVERLTNHRCSLNELSKLLWKNVEKECDGRYNEQTSFQQNIVQARLLSIRWNDPSKIRARYYVAKAITSPVIMTRLDDVLKTHIREDYREIL